MHWNDISWNVYHEEVGGLGHYLWIVSFELDAVRPGDHVWHFIDKETGVRGPGQVWTTALA